MKAHPIAVSLYCHHLHNSLLCFGFELAHGHRNSEQPTDEGGVFRARHPHLLKFSAAVAQVHGFCIFDRWTM